MKFKLESLKVNWVPAKELDNPVIGRMDRILGILVDGRCHTVHAMAQELQLSNQDVSNGIHQLQQYHTLYCTKLGGRTAYRWVKENDDDSR